MTTDRWNDGKKFSFDSWAKQTLSSREVRTIIKEHEVLVDINGKGVAEELEMTVHEMTRLLPEHVKFTKKFRFDRELVGENLVKLKLTYECLELVDKSKPTELLP